MKKIIALIITLALVSIASVSFAADKLLDVKITNVTEKNDKNGNPYMRLSFAEKKTLGTITYDETKSIMVFSDKIGLVKAMGIKSGSQLKAVCSENEYKGRIGYVLIAPDTTTVTAAVTPAASAPVANANMAVPAPVAPVATTR